MLFVMLTLVHWNQGIEGIVKFTGSTPDLGEFNIRIEDGKNLLPCLSCLIFECECSISGPDVAYVTEGRDEERFSRKLGKTSFVGLPLPQGGSWKAKGRSCLPHGT